MRPLRLIFLYLAFVFAGGALLAPWLYWLVQGLGDLAGSLARQPFHRFVNRAFLVLALAGLWPFLRYLGVRNWRSVGIARGTSMWREAGRGFAIGFISLAAVAVITLIAGARELALPASAGALAGRLAGALATAIVVGCLEELLFRGALHGALRRENPLWLAMLVSSGLYALLHFFQRPAAPEEIHWFTGLQLLPAMLRGLVELPALVPGFFNLLLAGAILATAFERTGRLYTSIGLHGGWIFWLKSYGALTRETAGASTQFWGTGRLIDGWFALIVLGLVAWGVARRGQKPETHSPPA